MSWYAEKKLEETPRPYMQDLNKEYPSTSNWREAYGLDKPGAENITTKDHANFLVDQMLEAKRRKWETRDYMPDEKWLNNRVYEICRLGQ